jgi:F-type H+-transporting ATPase subunit c
MDLTFFGAGIGAAFAVFGAGYGISRLSSSALEGIARQPEAAGDLRGTMIIAAALIEGIAFMALVICLLLVLLK